MTVSVRGQNLTHTVANSLRAAAGEAMRKLIQEALDLIAKRDAAQAARRLAGNVNR